MNSGDALLAQWEEELLIAGDADPGSYSASAAFAINSLTMLIRNTSLDGKTRHVIENARRMFILSEKDRVIAEVDAKAHYEEMRQMHSVVQEKDNEIAELREELEELRRSAR